MSCALQIMRRMAHSKCCLTLDMNEICTERAFGKWSHGSEKVWIGLECRQTPDSFTYSYIDRTTLHKLTYNYCHRNLSPMLQGQVDLLLGAR